MTRDDTGGLGGAAKGQRLKILLGVFLAAQAALLVCLVDPWRLGWREPGLTFLVLELIFLAALFAPLFCYFLLKRKMSAGQSARAALDTFLDWMGYLTP